MSTNSSLVTAIIFSSLLISGSLIFLGIKINPQPGVSAPIADEKPQIAEPTQEVDEKKEVIKVKKVSQTDDHIRGSIDAEISLIEYSDFECPFCKRFHPTAQQIVDAYEGRVNWVYRHFPLSFHDPLATKEAEASECAAELGGNDKFWEYADKIYDETESNGSGLKMTDLAKIAADVGLNKDKFQECLDSGKYTGKVQKDIQEGAEAGVNGTPGNILINNQTGETRSIDGAQPFPNFKSVIDDMLN